MTYTGDIKIKQLKDGTFDIEFINGQPTMTNGLETMLFLAIFGQRWWGNLTVKKESEKMKSTFPDIIKRNVVTDKVKNDGTKSIEKATDFIIKDKIAKSVLVTGEIFSAFGIKWTVEVVALNNNKIEYFLNWEKGILTAGTMEK